MQYEYFSESNIPAGLINAPSTWQPDQIKDYQDFFDSILAGNTAERTKVIWTPEGSKYQAFKEPPLKDMFDEWLARVVCYAFSLPPTPFVERAPNRSSSETLQEAAMAEGLAPLTSWVERFVNHVNQRVMGHTDLLWAYDVEQPMDPQDQATVIDKYLKDGVYSINQAGAILGEDPIPDGDEHLLLAGSTWVKVSDVANPPVPPPPSPAAAQPPGPASPNAEAPAAPAGEEGPSKAGEVGKASRRTFPRTAAKRGAARAHPLRHRDEGQALLSAAREAARHRDRPAHRPLGAAGRQGG
jgi:hypothetical protein